jgi:hypothetical protein
MPWTWLENHWGKLFTIVLSILGGIWGASKTLTSFTLKQNEQAERIKLLEDEHRERVSHCPNGQMQDMKDKVNQMASDISYMRGVMDTVHIQITKRKMDKTM